jgi:biopolymer transport protein ExbB/TolQ
VEEHGKTANKANYMNEFLKLLLPWQEAPNDQISDFFVYIIGGAFILLGIYFFLRTFFQCRLINGLAKKVPKHRPARSEDLMRLKQEFPEDERFSLKKRFSGKRKLNEAWQDFEDSLIPRQRDDNQEVVYKTDEASLFFSEDSLLAQHMNLRFWNSVPALLVGFGILGTFVGLVWGLRSFFGIDDFTSDEIREAIKKLLPGVSTAFVTSVWGMLTSLLFNGLEKWRINGVNRAIAELQHVLDQLFTLTTQEEIAFRQEDELEQQTAALKSFSTDLANDIKRAMASIISEARVQDERGNQEIIQELHNVPDAISNALEKKLTPRFDSLSTIVSDIQIGTEQGRQEILQELDKIRLSLGQIKTLADVIGEVGENLISLPEYVAQIAHNIQEFLKSGANQTDERIKQWLGDMDEFLQRSAQTLQDIQQSTSNLLHLQSEQIDAINKQLVNTRATLARGRDMLEQMNESVTSVRQINEENQKYLAVNRDSMQQIQRALMESQQPLNDSVQRFQTINKELQGIFAEIDKGLKTYATSTRRSINTYISDFSSQLESALEALSGTVEVLSDTVEDLKDKSKGRK